MTAPDTGRRSPRAQEKSGVLSIKPFRRLWVALSLSSLGDWLSILALTALAAELTGKHTAGQSEVGAMAAQSAAVAGSGSRRCCRRCCSARSPG